VNEDVVVVVGGLLTEVMVMGTLVAAATDIALILTRIELVLVTEQVELILQEQLEVPMISDISPGTVIMIFEPVIRALTVVNETVREETTPIDVSNMLAALITMVDTVADTVTLPESMEYKLPLTRFLVRKVILLLREA